MVLSSRKSLQEVFQTKRSAMSLVKIRLSKFAVLLGDLMAIVLAFVLTVFVCTWLTTQPSYSVVLWWSEQDHLRMLSWGIVGFFGTLLLLIRYQHYSDRRPFWDELGDFLRLIGLLALLDMSLIAINRWEVSLLWWLLSWGFLLVLLVVMRSVTRLILKRLNLWIRPAIIIGVGANAADAALALQSQPELGLQVLGFVSVDASMLKPHYETQPRLQLDQIKLFARQPGVQWVIALEHAEAEQREHWLRMLAQWGATDISVIPAMRGVPLHGTDISHFFSHEVAMLRMRNNLRRWPARLTKRIFDTLTAIFLLILLSPVMLIIAYMIRRDGGPAVFAHPRVGKRGKIFKCFKFRTMVVDAENQLEKLLQIRPELRSEWEADRKLLHDPRVSPLGRFLRRSSLDELPQLLNVVRGEMSLVGPRPVVRTELRRFGSDASYYLLVRPGMTGLWQISGRSSLDYDKRVYLDAWYVKNWSFWYDLIILFKTINVVLARQGAY